MSPGREPDFEVDGEVTSEAPLRSGRRASDPLIGVARVADHSFRRFAKEHGVVAAIAAALLVLLGLIGWRMLSIFEDNLKTLAAVQKDAAAAQYDLRKQDSETFRSIAQSLEAIKTSQAVQENNQRILMQMDLRPRPTVPEPLPKRLPR